MTAKKSAHTCCYVTLLFGCAIGALSTIGAINGSPALAKNGDPQANAIMAPYQVFNEAGQEVISALLPFGTQFSDATTLTSQTIQLRITGTDTGGTVTGITRNCSVGNRNISRRNVRMLLDGLTTISISRAKSLFSVVLKIDNVSQYQGAIACDPITLRVNP